MKKLFTLLLTFALLPIAWSQCDYNLRMFDDWGDGWNGSTIDVLVNGVVVLDDVGLPGGAGPVDLPFTVNTGDNITTIWNGGGIFDAEIGYEIVDPSGVIVGSENMAGPGTPAGSTAPVGISAPIAATCPSCLTPGNLATINIASDSATGTWGAVTGAVNYQVEYGATGFTQGTGTVTLTTDTFMNVSSLMSSTEYDWYVRAICAPGDTSFWSGAVTFLTNCLPHSTFPYVEDFESGANGWFTSGTNGTWELATPANTVIIGAASGVNAWVTNATGNYNANDLSFVEKCFDFTSLTNPEIRVSVWWESEFSWDGAKLQSSVDGGSTWTTVGANGDPNNWYNDGTVNGLAGLDNQDGWTGRNGATASNGWVVASHALTGLAGQPDVRLRFAFGSDGSGQDDGFAFDDITIYDLTCPSPTALTDSNVTDVSAILGWTAGGAETEWQIEYGPVGFAPGAGTVVSNVTANPYTLSGLTPETDYDFYVSAICAPGDTSFPSAAGNFTTDIAALVCSSGNPSFVYSENFDASTSLPTGWSRTGPANMWRGDANGTGSTGTGPADDITGGGNYFYTEATGPGSGALDTLISAPIDLTNVNTPARVLFNYHMFGAAMGTLTVEYSADGGITWNAGAAFTGPQQTADTDPWSIASFDVSSAIGNTLVIRFVGQRGSGFTSDMAIDEVRVEACVSCLAPVALNPVFVGPDTIALNFVQPAFTDSFIVQAGVAGSIDTTFVTTDTFLSFGSLIPQTNYEIFVTSICAGTDTSVAVSGSLTTPCAYEVAPFFEGFGASVSGDPCWNFASTTGGPWVWSTGNGFPNPGYDVAGTPGNTGACGGGSGNDGYYFMDFSGTDVGVVMELPIVDASALTSPELVFFMVSHYLGTLTPYNLLFVEASDGMGGWNGIDTIQEENGPDWDRYSYDLSAYTYGSGLVQIRFRAESGGAGNDFNNDILLDDILIRQGSSTCPDPIELEATNLTDVSATLTWTEAGTATLWEVVYGPAGFTPNGGGALGSAVVAVDTFDISGLMAQTDYSFYVRSLCDTNAAGDSSVWSFQNCFRTRCAGFTVVYTQNFDATVEPEIDECWSTLLANTTGTPAVRTENGFPLNGGTGIPSAPNGVILQNGSSSSAADIFLISPRFTDFDNEKRVRFMGFSDEGAAGSDLIVGTMSDPTDATTFVPYQTITAAELGQDNWQEYVIQFNNYVGTDEYVAFKHGANTTFDDLGIDNFVYEPIPPANVGVIEVLQPENGCGEEFTSIEVVLENVGTDTQYNVPVVVEITGAVTDSLYLVVPVISAYSVDTFVIDSINTLAGGTYDFTIFTDLGGDVDTDNDSITASVNFGFVPDAPMVNSEVLCVGDSVLLVATGNGNNTYWYDVADTSGNLVATGDSIYVQPATTTSYYAVQEGLGPQDITLTLVDDFGDGWNGGSLSVNVNGTPITLTLSGQGLTTSPMSVFNPPGIGTEVESGVFTVTSGDTVFVELTAAGSFPGEVGFQLEDQNGNVIVSGGDFFGNAPITAGSVGVFLDSSLVFAGCYGDFSDAAVVTVSTPTTVTFDIPLCDGDVYVRPNGGVVTAAGTYVDSLANAYGCDSVIVSEVVVSPVFNDTVPIVLCQGDFYQLPGGFGQVVQGGSYVVPLTTVNGCDSIITFDVTVVNSFTTFNSPIICAGQAFTVGTPGNTSTYFNTGVYVDSLLSSAGCDSVVTTSLVVVPLTNVVIGNIGGAVCQTASDFTLSLTPAGGDLTGPGAINDSTFSPSTAGIGTHTLTYTYNDNNGCVSSSTVEIIVEACTDISNLAGIETITVFPNPFNDVIKVNFTDEVAGDIKLSLLDLMGKEVTAKTFETAIGENTIQFKIESDVASGMYMLKLERNGATHVVQLNRAK